MNLSKYGAFLSSSVNDQKLAATIEGAIATIGAFLVFMGFLDVATETTLLSHVNQLITDVTVITPLIISIGGLCYTIFGLLRKAFVTIVSAKKTAPIAVAQEPNQP